MGSFLLGLTSAVPALARFVLGDTNRAAVPVHPCGLEVCNLPSTKPESACDETDESRFKIVWCWKGCACFQQEFELAVSKDIFVSMSSRECLAMPISPLSSKLLVVRPVVVLMLADWEYRRTVLNRRGVSVSSDGFVQAGNTGELKTDGTDSNPRLNIENIFPLEGGITCCPDGSLGAWDNLGRSTPRDCRVPGLLRVAEPSQR